MKNYERLQQMSLEELGREICDWISDCSYACPGSDMCNMRGPAANGLIKWLNMEVEEDGEKNSMGAGPD